MGQIKMQKNGRLYTILYQPFRCKVTDMADFFAKPICLFVRLAIHYFVFVFRFY